MSRSRYATFPIAGRYRNAQNKPLTLDFNGRTDLPPPRQSPVARVAHWILSRRFQGSNELPLIDYPAFAILVRVGKKHGLIELDDRGFPVYAARFFRALEPYRPFFAKGDGDPLPRFRELVERARHREEDVFASMVASPHDF